VVCHDGNTGRTGDVALEIKESSLVELQGVDVAEKFRRGRGIDEIDCPPHRIPTLEEVLGLS